MTIKELKEIALHCVRGTAPAEFTVSQCDQAFADGLKSLMTTYNDFQRNKYDIFDIMIEAIDEKMPKDVISALSPFAEVKVVGENQKALFKKSAGRQRAKKFLTQVGLSGVYETFRLDKQTFEVSAHAVGGGATVDFERMMDAAESLAECVDIITEGLTNAVFIEVQRALKNALNATNRPAANKHTASSFVPNEMVKLMGVVRAYGDPVIFAPPEFIAAMGADAIVPVGSNYAGIYSPDDIEAIHRTGFINLFRGAPIVQIPQSFIHENNKKTWIDPQLAYIMPGGKEKVVKVVLEGATRIKEFENRDNSTEVYAWKKMGVAVLTNHDWAIYQNTGITQTMDQPYGI